MIFLVALFSRPFAFLMAGISEPLPDPFGFLKDLKCGTSAQSFTIYPLDGSTSCQVTFLFQINTPTTSSKRQRKYKFSSKITQRYVILYATDLSQHISSNCKSILE